MFAGEGKAVVVVVNKWDKVDTRLWTVEKMEEEVGVWRCAHDVLNQNHRTSLLYTIIIITVLLGSTVLLLNRLALETRPCSMRSEVTCQRSVFARSLQLIPTKFQVLAGIDDLLLCMDLCRAGQFRSRWEVRVRSGCYLLPSSGLRVEGRAQRFFPIIV